MECIEMIVCVGMTAAHMYSLVSTAMTLDDEWVSPSVCRAAFGCIIMIMIMACYGVSLYVICVFVSIKIGFLAACLFVALFGSMLGLYAISHQDPGFICDNPNEPASIALLASFRNACYPALIISGLTVGIFLGGGLVAMFKRCTSFPVHASPSSPTSTFQPVVIDIEPIAPNNIAPNNIAPNNIAPNNIAPNNRVPHNV